MSHTLQHSLIEVPKSPTFGISLLADVWELWDRPHSPIPVVPNALVRTVQIDNK